MKTRRKKPDSHEKPNQRVIARSEFGRTGKNGLIRMAMTAVRDLDTGETRLVVTIPDADRIRLPDDLPVMLQTFGWAAACLRLEMGDGGTADFDAWRGCCSVVGRLEYEFELE